MSPTLTTAHIAALPDIIKIQSVEGVRIFFALLLDAGFNFHPDERFADYVDHATGRDCFTIEEASGLDDLMAQAFAACRAADLDVYAVGLDVWRAWEAHP